MPLSQTARRRILRDTADNIRKHGQSVVYVGAVEWNDIPFHYTIGRAARGLPELLLTGPTDPETGMRLLNELDRLMPTKLPSGARVSLGGKYPVLLLDATDPIAKEEYTLLASAYHKTDSYLVQQVVFCDKNGRFPSDPQCARPYSLQRLLGEPEILQ